MRGFYYQFLAREQHMTFQVALLGKDGFVIASDTKIIQLEGFRSSSHTNKIFSAPGIPLVCACSGESDSYIVKQKLFDSIFSDPELPNSEKMLSTLYKLGSETWKFNHGGLAIPQDQVLRSTLIVAFYTKNGSKLWSVDILPSPECHCISDKTIAGDRGNAAVYFLERYFKQNTLVKNLVFLAGYAVLMAGNLKPATVGGLEIILCENGQLLHLSKDQIKELEDQSKTLDSTIDETLFRSTFPKPYPLE